MSATTKTARYTIHNSQSSDGGIIVDGSGDQATSIYGHTDDFRQAVADAATLVRVMGQPAGAVAIHDAKSNRWFFLDADRFAEGIAELNCIENGQMCVHPSTYRIDSLLQK